MQGHTQRGTAHGKTTTPAHGRTAWRLKVAFAIIGIGFAAPAWSADLPLDAQPRFAVRPAPPPHPLVYPTAPYVEDLGPPASDHGYYGYYGFDLFGTPYDGLYSANVLCLRSIRTAYGYRTVDVCRSQ